MTKTLTGLTALSVAFVSLPALAFAQLTLGEPLGVQEDAIRAALMENGAEVIEIEIDGDEIEVEYTLDGVSYEVELDPATGVIVALELEDDDADEDETDD